MIEILNNFLKVRSSDKELFSILKDYLRIVDDSDKDNVILQDLFTVDDNGDMLIPRGLDQFIPDQVPRVNQEKILIPRDFSIDYENLAHKFGSIVLRDDQLIGIRKMLMLRRGIMQLATGAGKTEIMTGFLMALEEICGKYPTTIILEPTTLLVDATVERMNKYGVPAAPYSESRGVIEGIMVTHPSSLNNDLKKNPDLLKNLKVFLSDEGHHLQADTWNRLLKSAPGIEFSIAMSASVINPARIPVTELNHLDYGEALVIGATGNIILNIPPSFYIEAGILATPILYRIMNSADEWIKRDNDWHQIRKYRLESPKRTMLLAKISTFLASVHYKSLILVGTKEHAYRILELVHSYGLGDVCRCSFGGGVYFKYDNQSDKVVKCKNEDTMDGFKSGEFKILIGTSHIYEGADIPDLDVIILASVGKGLRKYIQGVGRGLRRSKTGKYAHIVDFTDHYDRVLNKHSLDRLDMFRTVIGVSDTNIYESLSFERFKEVFCRIEGIC